MSKKLLHKTQRVYLIFSILLFAIVAPLFYIISNRFYVAEVDETLRLHKSEFLINSSSKLKLKDISDWNRFNTSIKITDSIGLTDDSLFYVSYFNPIENENEPYRVLKSPINIEGRSYTLSIKSNLLESKDLVISIALLFSTILILLFFGLLIINKKLSLRLWKPFYQTLQQIESFEIDSLKRPDFLNSDIEEFNRLNTSIDNLINRNIIIYNNQREFVENAAHELQTPIAIFKAKVDTLIQRSDVTKGQSEILTSINNAIARLNRLNKNLLLLSKIDKQQFEEKETFSIKELIENQLDFFNEQAIQQNIYLKTNLENDISITANIGLTEIIVSNLLLNSIRHNVKDGQINISISGQKMIISNTGVAESLSEEKLFNRFSKSSSLKQGNGLGLAIVKKIADLNNWSISYSYINNRHSFFLQF